MRNGRIPEMFQKPSPVSAQVYRRLEETDLLGSSEATGLISDNLSQRWYDPLLDQILSRIHQIFSVEVFPCSSSGVAVRGPGWWMARSTASCPAASSMSRSCPTSN